MTYSKRDFGLRLMYARKKAGLTQDQLADATGIDKNSIARYETGTNTPRLDKAYTLAAALRCSINELAGLPAPASADAPEASQSIDFYKSAEGAMR